jgi:teichoic acid transport system permease protein
MNIFFNFVKHDIKKKISALYFGIFWLLFKPIISIVVMWGVFTYGLKTSPQVDGSSFIVWLSAGLVIWFFFTECLTSVSDALIEYKFLLKQSSFSPQKIILVKLISSSISLIILMILLYIFYFFTQEIHFTYVLTSFYYILCLYALIFSLGLILSSFKLFIKDIGEIISSCFQLFFWLTPIVWNLKLIPKEFQWFVSLNPLTYIIEGMRSSFSSNPIIFYNSFDIKSTLFFWSLIILTLLIGILVFSKLKPHFNEAL